MRVAFVGKGGSGKTTLSALSAQWLRALLTAPAEAFRARHGGRAELLAGSLADVPQHSAAQLTGRSC